MTVTAHTLKTVTATRALLIHGGARVHLVVGQAVLHCLGGLTQVQQANAEEK